ncbi:MAG: hypothetical protein ACRD3K_09810, partial [Edaphobacter sp.]
LYPKGNYVIVRRFSSKEEKRRVVANVVDPEDFPANLEVIAFENSLNVFHQKKRGLDRELAYGLAEYLNSKEFDDEFRNFNGHTQVNATDLRAMHYPAVEALRRMGKAAYTRTPRVA